MEIIRIGAAGIACVLAAIFMKTAKPESAVCGKKSREFLWFLTFLNPFQFIPVNLRFK